MPDIFLKRENHSVSTKVRASVVGAMLALCVVASTCLPTSLCGTPATAEANVARSLAWADSPSSPEGSSSSSSAAIEARRLYGLNDSRASSSSSALAPDGSGQNTLPQEALAPQTKTATLDDVANLEVGNVLVAGQQKTASANDVQGYVGPWYGMNKEAVKAIEAQFDNAAQERFFMSTGACVLAAVAIVGAISAIVMFSKMHSLRMRPSRRR